MEKIYTISNHPTIVDVTRKVQYIGFEDNPIKEHLKVYTLVKYEKDGSKVSGMIDRNVTLSVDNKTRIIVSLSTGLIVEPEPFMFEEDYDFNANYKYMYEYDYWVEVAQTPIDFYGLIEQEINKAVSKGLYD